MKKINSVDYGVRNVCKIDTVYLTERGKKADTNRLKPSATMPKINDSVGGQNYCIGISGFPPLIYCLRHSNLTVFLLCLPVKVV